jgi:hypothetical protein
MRSISEAIATLFRGTVLLLKGQGANNADNNVLVDSSVNNFSVSRSGNATQGSFSPYSAAPGYWSNYFGGSGDYLSMPGSLPLQLGAGDFTIETWVYRTTAGLMQLICGYANGSNSGRSYYLGYSANGVTPIFSWYVDGVTVNTITSNTSTTLNSWNHIAVVRNANTVTMFLNGVSVASSAMTGSLYNPAGAVFEIGREAAFNGNYVTGYLSNIRLVKGSAVYTANFTPSTAPLTAIAGTSLLTCQGNRFMDSSINNLAITAAGNPSVSSFSAFAKEEYTTALGGSAYFDGSGDFLSVDMSSVSPLAGDFTWESWVYDIGTTAYGTLLGWRTGAAGWQGLIIQRNNGTNNLLVACGNQDTTITQTSGTYLKRCWNHVALVKAGSTVTLYVNGLNSGTVSSPTSFNPGAAYRTGSDPFNNIATAMLNGYVSNQRFVNGTAIYTANFTPPTAPVTAITGTSLLLNATNGAIFDSTGSADLETVGNAKISTTQFKYGTSSMYFDGTGDYLSIANNPSLNLSSGNFTVETWVYLSKTGSQTFVNKDGISGSVYSTFGLGVNASTQPAFFMGRSDGATVGQAITGTAALSINTWYHVAATRSGSNISLYVNGISVAVQR